MSKYTIEQSICHSLDEYFKDLNGSQPYHIFDMVMACVEKPMLETVLKHTKGNQSLAAEYLGINRNTLRKKLQQYNLI